MPGTGPYTGFMALNEEKLNAFVGRFISDAIECYIRERPEAEQRMVDELANRTKARATRARRRSWREAME